MAQIDEILDDFSFLDDWEDRYRYVIELGRKLPELPEVYRVDAYKVEGCASQVWLRAHQESADDQSVLRFEGDSDAHIVRGLIAILFAIYSGKSPSDIVNTDIEGLLTQLGLEDHLTKQRANGLHSMIQRIKREAADVLSETA